MHYRSLVKVIYVHLVFVSAVIFHLLFQKVISKTPYIVSSEGRPSHPAPLVSWEKSFAVQFNIVEWFVMDYPSHIWTIQTHSKW